MPLPFSPRACAFLQNLDGMVNAIGRSLENRRVGNLFASHFPTHIFLLVTSYMAIQAPCAAGKLHRGLQVAHPHLPHPHATDPIYRVLHLS